MSMLLDQNLDATVRLTETINRRIDAIKSPCSVQRLRDIRSLLVMKTNFYKAEKERVKSMLDMLHLNDADLSYETQTMITELAQIQEEFKTNECDCESVSLASANRKSKKIHYLAKIKVCNKVYDKLIKRIAKEIQYAQSELESSEARCKYLSASDFDDERKKLQLKIEKYENELAKFEKKFPWLKDSKYNVQAISKEIETLTKLRSDRDKLVAELDIYKGLKPDLNEATRQYAEVKLQYMSLM